MGGGCMPSYHGELGEVYGCAGTLHPVVPYKEGQLSEAKSRPGMCQSRNRNLA